MKRTTLLAALLTIATLGAWAQGPNGTGTYYQAADGKKGEELKTALYNILRYSYYTFVDEDGFTQTKKYTMVSYNGLFDAYLDTDLREDGYIWDMYSNTSNYLPSQYGSNYTCEAPGPAPSGKDAIYYYNREHSVPQSWFDGKKGTVPYSDLFHVYPTDGYVNNRRSNLPFGKVGATTYTSHNNFSKVGSCVTPGYTGKVFEPNDIYKGDFARTYFYMATCHQNVDFTKSDEGAAVFEKSSASTYPGIKSWALNMFMEWSQGDAVSEKELNRNHAVSLLQFNRNPFIDYPGLEQYIWGSMKDVAFSYDNYQIPDNYSPNPPGDDPGDDPGVNPGDNPGDTPTPAEGENLYLRIASTDELEVGAGYIIVCESQNVAMAEQGDNIRNYVTLETTDGAVITEVNESGKPYELTLGTNSGKYTLFDATGNVYLSQTTKNKLNTSTSPDNEAAHWTITFSDNNAVITSSYSSGFTIQYNSGAPRFACYSSNQKPVQLYKRQPKEEPVEEPVTTAIASRFDTSKPNTIVYDLQGRPVATTADIRIHLKKGIYIINKKKIIIK